MIIKSRKKRHIILKLKLLSLILFLDSMRHFVSDTEKKEGLVRFKNNLAFVLEAIRCK